MNSTVLTFLVIAGLSAFPERPQATPAQPLVEQVVQAPAVSYSKPCDQARRLAKGRQVEERLKLRMEQRIATQTVLP